MDVEFELNKLIKFRKDLHQYPELSGQEFNTAQRIKSYIKKFNPDQIIENIGETGLAILFEGKEKGPTVLFRCDLDALPISEVNDFEYKSKNEGVGHKCGHDGHMTIITALAELISKSLPERGKAVLLFQPSEENGEGAEKVLADPKFNLIEPDYVFALHNLPGFPKGSIITNESIFASASKGMIVKLYGRTSHAGEPENGLSPAIAMADIVKGLTYLPREVKFKDFTLVTVIHSRLGEIAFGTTPGYAEVMATLRSHTNNDMEQLVENAEEIVKQYSNEHGLKYEISWTEEFLATENNNEAVKVIEEAGKKENLKIIRRKEPFRWSEDFSHFTINYPGALFGLGSGEQSPQLHNPDYDFPDDIIEPGMKVFYEVYRKYLKE